MQSKAFFAFLLFCAFFAFCSARPLVFASEQRDTNLVNTTNGWSGVAMLWGTGTKGKNNHRIRVFGTNNINDTLRGAYLAHTNGTRLVTLQISTNPLDRYCKGDVRVNETVYGFLLNNLVQLVVTSNNFPNGAIGGIFYASPGLGLAILDGSQAGTSSSAVGFGLSWVRPPSNLPLDLVQHTAALLNSLTYTARVMHNVSSPTGATYSGPANTTSVGPTIFTLTSTSAVNSFFLSGFSPVSSDVITFQQLALTYFAVSNSGGVNIRGQIYPLLTRTRRSIPTHVQTVYGITDVPASGFDTLRYANQEENERNRDSFFALTTTQINATSNFTYQGEWYFPAATTRRNFETIRALLLELNVRIVGNAATWNFDYFDSTTGAHFPAGTFSTVQATWLGGILLYNRPAVADFANIRGQLVVRITCNSAVSSTLWLDLFGVRTYEPGALFNQLFKTPLKQLLLLPAQ